MTQEIELLLVAFLLSPFIQSFLITLLLLLGLGLRDWSAGFLAVLLGMSVAYLSGAQNGTAWLPQEGDSVQSYILQRESQVHLLTTEQEVERLRAQIFADQTEISELQRSHLQVAVSTFGQLRTGLSQGMKLLIPFLLIELIVGLFLLLSRLETISLVFATLPIKIFLFLAVDGVSLFRNLLLTPLAQ
jgi:hypothetical protein